MPTIKKNPKMAPKKAVKSSQMVFKLYGSKGRTYLQHPCSIFVAQLKQALTLSYAIKPGYASKAAFIAPIIEKLESDEEAKIMNVVLICYRRCMDGRNKRMPENPNSSFGFRYFIRVYEDIFENA